VSKRTMGHYLKSPSQSWAAAYTLVAMQSSVLLFALNAFLTETVDNARQ
jgi:hypothetical protein